VTFYVFCRLGPPKSYMYSSELHRGVNDLISISRHRTLFAMALNKRVISIVFFVAEVNEAACEPFSHSWCEG